MTSRLSLIAKNALLGDQSLQDIAGFMSLCGLPPLAGSTELTTRQPITWATASGGCREVNGPIDFTVPAAGTVHTIACWETGGAGVCTVWAPYGSRATRAFAAVGDDLTTNVLRSEAHGLQVDDHVLVWASLGALLPEPLAEDTPYYVVGVPDANSFLLSESQGGSVVNIVGEGDGDVQFYVPAEFAGTGFAGVSQFSLCLPG